MQRILHLMKKEFRQIFRDRSMIAILFVAPLLQLFVIGNAVTTDVLDVRLVIHDADRTPMSRELIGHFLHSRYFRVVDVEDDVTRLPAWLDEGRASLALSIPANFARDVIRGSRPALQLLVDALDGNSAGIATGYAMDILSRYQVDVVSGEPRLAMAQRGARRVEAEPRFWYNPNLESRVYIIPGVVAMILVIITLFLTSMAIVREKEIGTLEQLMVTPIRAWQLILGKVLPFAILGFIEIMLTMTFVWLVFGIGVKGSILLLLGESALFILTTLSLGIFISTISETQQQALFVAWFFMIFSILLSGFFVPIANMPDSVQIISMANPVRYFLTVLREIYLKGSTLDELLPETLAMAGFGVTLMSLAVLRFRRKLS